MQKYLLLPWILATSAQTLIYFVDDYFLLKRETVRTKNFWQISK